jgi:hypothetical protein
LTDITPADMKFKNVAGVEQRMFASQLAEFCVDEQRIGPYRFWYLEHFFETVEIGVKVTDRARYTISSGVLSELPHCLWIQPKVAAIFDFWREKITALFGEA